VEIEAAISRTDGGVEVFLLHNPRPASSTLNGRAPVSVRPLLTSSSRCTPEHGQAALAQDRRVDSGRLLSALVMPSCRSGNTPSQLRPAHGGVRPRHCQTVVRSGGVNKQMVR
jgi:hypothetical protein